jgi:uncharacterized protein RhaS with RHS repeats
VCQTDPVGYDAGLNLYAYVNNDPLNRADPTGKSWTANTAVANTFQALNGAYNLNTEAAFASANANLAVQGELAAPAAAAAAAMQVADIGSDLEALGGGIPKLVPTSKEATQFIFPNGMVLRFDFAPGQYLSGQGPHINLEGGGENIHIPLVPGQ